MIWRDTMRKITVDQVFASYEDDFLREVLYRVRNRVYSTLEVLAEREHLIEADDFFYHFFYHAQHKCIQRIAKRYGMKWEELYTLVQYYHPDGYYYYGKRLIC